MLDASKNVQDIFPTNQIFAATKEDMCAFAMLGDGNTNTLYTYLPGRCLVNSCNGMNYIVMAYTYKLNSILLRAMKLQ